MRLVHLSDLHFGAIEQGMPEALREAVLAAKPDMLVVSGDLAQTGTIAQLTEAKTFLDSIPLPQLIVPGNHDLPRGWRLFDRFWRPWHSYRRIVSEDIEPVWDTSELLIIGTNSARAGGWYFDWSRGRLSGRQLERVRTVCEKASPTALRILVVHHPPAAPLGNRRRVIDRRTRLFSAINEAGIDLILAGHFHLSYALSLALPGDSLRSCVLSVTSTATSHRLKGEPNGFHVIEGNAAELNVQACSWNGETYQTSRGWTFQSSGVLRDWILV